LPTDQKQTAVAADALPRPTLSDAAVSGPVIAAP
jgi:hypothetical protein